MKNSVLFAVLFAFTFGATMPLVSKNNSQEKTAQVKTASECAQSYCPSDADCDADDVCCTSSNSSWLSNTWCSVRNWVMNLFCKNKCSNTQCSPAKSADSAQDDSEEENK